MEGSKGGSTLGGGPASLSQNGYDQGVDEVKWNNMGVQLATTAVVWDVGGGRRVGRPPGVMAVTGDAP